MRIAKMIATGVLEGGAAPVVYDLYDQFTTDDDSPVTSPRTCEPGPGTLEVIEANNVPVITGGKLVVNGSTAAEQLVSTPNKVIFKAGKILSISPVITLYNGASFNLSTTKASGILDGFYFIGSTRCDLRDNTSSIALASVTTGTEYTFVMRENGGYFFILDNRLLWVSRAREVTDRYFVFGFGNAGANFSIDNAKVYQGRGAWLTEYGLATARSATPASAAVINHAADALVEISWTPAAGETLTLLFRRADDDNCLKLVCDQAGGTIKLYKREAGTDSELDAGKTQTWTVGTLYRITARFEGSWVQTRVSGVRKHDTTQAFGATNTTTKATSTEATPTLANYVSWPVNLTDFPFA